MATPTRSAATSSGLGLEVFRQTGVDRVGDWETAREMTQRERVLFTDTERSRPVDFHSWRRAYNQALADAGVKRPAGPGARRSLEP